jgi:hypothetical protein
MQQTIMAEKTGKSSGLYDNFFAEQQQKQAQIKRDAWQAKQLQEKEEIKAKKRQRQQHMMQLEYEYAQQLFEMKRVQMDIMRSMLFGDDIENEFDAPGPSVDIQTYDNVMKRLKNIPTEQLEQAIQRFRLNDNTRMEIIKDILLERSEDSVVKIEKTEKEKQDTVVQVKKIEDNLRNVTSDDNTECAICLDKIAESASQTSCGHTFHHSCIIDWVNVKPSCPICKTNLA